jgi:hypothetical protein
LAVSKIGPGGRDVKIFPATLAVAMPGPTYPAKRGSCPLPAGDNRDSTAGGCMYSNDRQQIIQVPYELRKRKRQALDHLYCYTIWIMNEFFKDLL